MSLLESCARSAFSCGHTKDTISATPLQEPSPPFVRLALHSSLLRPIPAQQPAKSPIGDIHTALAAVFFLTLAYFALVLFRKTSPLCAIGCIQSAATGSSRRSRLLQSFIRFPPTRQSWLLLRNHSPLFAPVIQPTLTTGIETLVVAAQAWLSAQPTIH
jgi:hypothetical protein